LISGRLVSGIGGPGAAWCRAGGYQQRAGAAMASGGDGGWLRRKCGHSGSVIVAWERSCVSTLLCV